MKSKPVSLKTPGAASMAALLLFLFFNAPLFSETKSPDPVSGKDILSIETELAEEPAFELAGSRLTLGDVIRLVLEQNRDILSSAYDVAMTDSDYLKYKQKYSPYLTLEGGAKHQEFPEAVHATAGKDQKTLDASAAISKMFSTGTRVSAGVRHEYTDISREPIDFMGTSIDMFGPSDYHQPAVFVSVQQELMKNFLGYTDRRQLEMLQNIGKIEREIQIYMLSGLVVEVVMDFWDLLIKISTLENAKLEVDETRKVRNIIRNNINIGLSESFQLNFYNTLVSGAEAKVIQAEQDYRDSLRKLLTTLNLDQPEILSGRAFMTEDLPVIDHESALESAYEKRADYNAALLNLRNAELDIQVQENTALPRVLLEINASSAAQRSDIPPAYRDTAGAKNPSIEARVRAEYPLTNPQQKTNIRDANFRKKQAELEYSKRSRIVRDEVTSAIERIETAHSIYLKSKEGRDQAERYYRGLIQNLRTGRFDANTVKDGLMGMVESRKREKEALIYYNLALLNFDVVKNELFERNRIDVDRYIPVYE